MYLLLIEAYPVNFFQLAGLQYAPERYRITASVPEGSTKEQFRQMLQKLLAERFKLKVHHEIREMPIYRMSIVRNGTPLRPHSSDGVMPAPDELTLEPASRNGQGWLSHAGPGRVGGASRRE
jgi:uncharacterized protein (TIGR03435 family)